MASQNLFIDEIRNKTKIPKAVISANDSRRIFITCTSSSSLIQNSQLKNATFRPTNANAFSLMLFLSQSCEEIGYLFSVLDPLCFISRFSVMKSIFTHLLNCVTRAIFDHTQKAILNQQRLQIRGKSQVIFYQISRFERVLVKFSIFLFF